MRRHALRTAPFFLSCILRAPGWRSSPRPARVKVSTSSVRFLPARVFGSRNLSHAYHEPMRGRSLAPILALVILAVAIHFTALSGFFLYDDPMILLESIRQPAAEVLFDPVEYAHLSATSFTPLLPLSFKLDRSIHGLDPRVFYIH